VSASGELVDCFIHRSVMALFILTGWPKESKGETRGAALWLLSWDHSCPPA
jgi:hypothetical protein